MTWQNDIQLTRPRRSGVRWGELTAPVGEPVTIADVRLALRVDHTADDPLITRLITAARTKIERDTNHVMLTRQFLSLRDHWRSPRFGASDTVRVLPGPVTAVDQVDYVTGGVLTTLDPSEYQTDLESIPARLAPAVGMDWPDPDDALNAVQIRFQAGYPDAASVPKALEQALYLLIGHWYENRVPFQQDGREPKEVPMGYDWLVKTFTRGSEL